MIQLDRVSDRQPPRFAQTQTPKERTSKSPPKVEKIKIKQQKEDDWVQVSKDEFDIIREEIKQKVRPEV